MSIPVPANESKRLEALRRYAILDTAAEQSFDDYAQLASLICGTPMAAVTLIDASRQWLKARVGIDGTETEREHAFCAYTILGDETMVVEDATNDARFSKNPFVTSAPNIRFYAGAPLIDRDGFGLGALCVVDSKPRSLNDEQRTCLEALARRVMAQIEWRRMSSELAGALEEIKTLHGLLPICAHCKGIRDDKGYWQSVEEYFCSHADVDFSHSICPSCVEIHFPEFHAKMKAKDAAG